ncbi:FecR domain-containing protein [Sphingomonas sp. GM_Shp_1]|uniref:FecR family protein n=1 Tax=Sphingomonas sp. GM_Shp_1 TaxID=2937381 RepID=UPI00226B9EDD
MPAPGDDAAAWALRHPLDAAGEHALEAWLASDPRNAGALLRAMAALTVVDRAITDDAETPPHRAPVARWSSRRGLLIGMTGAIAASVAGLIGWRQFAADHVTTARGEIRRLPFADGSVATIDSDSALRVVLASEQRWIALDRGQAWFQVAKDRSRPFVVDAGIAQARAVGTAFSVERRDDGVEVAVTEGQVAVWPSAASGTMTILHAGQYARFRSSDAAPVTGTAPAAIERALAWRGGEIALENETVAAAVARFNRYNHRQLVVDDAELAQERLIGLFQIDRPEDFAASLAASFPVAVTSGPDTIRLERKKSPPS